MQERVWSHAMPGETQDEVEATVELRESEDLLFATTGGGSLPLSSLASLPSSPTVLGKRKGASRSRCDMEETGNWTDGEAEYINAISTWERIANRSGVSGVIKAEGPVMGEPEIAGDFEERRSKRTRTRVSANVENVQAAVGRLHLSSPGEGMELATTENKYEEELDLDDMDGVICLDLGKDDQNATSRNFGQIGAFIPSSMESVQETIRVIEESCGESVMAMASHTYAPDCATLRHSDGSREHESVDSGMRKAVIGDLAKVQERTELMGFENSALLAELPFLDARDLIASSAGPFDAEMTAVEMEIDVSRDMPIYLHSLED